MFEANVEQKTLEGCADKCGLDLGDIEEVTQPNVPSTSEVLQFYKGGKR